MVSLKNDSLNEVLLRGCISLASSIANTTRLCNETMDTFMNLTDIGQLSEDEQKKSAGRFGKFCCSSSGKITRDGSSERSDRTYKFAQRTESKRWYQPRL